MAARHAGLPAHGRLARDRRPRPRLPHDGRLGIRPRPRERPPRLELERRLRDRVVADRPRRHRLLRRREREDVRARPAPPPAALEPVARGEDHVERLPRQRHDLHRRLCGPSVGACARFGEAALVGAGERDDLRHARGRRRPRLRPLLGRQLHDGFLDHGPLPLAVHRRGLRLLVAGRVGRPRLLRLVRRLVLRPLRLERRGPLACPHGRLDLRRCGDRLRHRVRGQLLAPDRRCRRPHGSHRPRFPARRLRPGLGQRGRLLLHGYARLYAVEPRHKAVHR